MYKWEFSLLDQISNEDFKLAKMCVFRATKAEEDQTGLLLGIIATHVIFNLRLEDWLNAGSADFYHDIAGIYDHFDRSNLTIKDGFCPRFAGKS